MRKSALMRRMWGRPCESGRACCCCGAEPCEPAPPGGRETRSLDGSRSELRPLSSLSSRYSHAAAGWATPKRQRLDSSRDFRGSDEMLRAAMKNSFDRAEESRTPHATKDLSDSTYRSHLYEPSSSYLETVTDAFTDSDGSKFDMTGEGNAFAQYTERQSLDTTTLEVKSTTADDANVTSENSAQFALSEARSLSDSSDSCSASYPTTKESAQLTRSAHIAGRVCARSSSLLRDDNDAVPYDKPLAIHTPSYELLEIVVSETLNVSSAPAVSAHALPPDKTTQHLRAPTVSQKCAQNINIDEYVSNILVESLNSLTDQLECMNASMGNDRKISIVEKEIKVKLQNTGVNTIVHLSPTSNNQIIFGNEELCINDDRKDCCNNPQDAHDAHVLAIRDEAHSVESNNNLTSAGSPGACPCESFDLQHDNVNQAVLQQIQKLFQDELHNLDPDNDYSGKTMPEISHIEISNVTDVFIDNESEPGGMAADRGPARGEYEIISGVGAGSYYPDVHEQSVVPRFSAFPHTDSMEVNTSSSDDADLMGSDCTSLVDSLDDPNSPRSVLLRRGFTGRRSELVRSAIDVLDLLPENARNEQVLTPKDKGEAFFVKIKDNECDCDKENVNVADRMPEKIKQRLYRRHRKREMRMECARRTRGKQRLRDRDAERRHDEHGRPRRDVERECVAIVNALIDDVINKIAQDEYKCMRIKHRPTRMVTSKSDDNVAKRTWKKELEQIDDRDPLKSLKNNTTQHDSYNSRKHKGERHQIHGKLSFVTRPTVASDDRAAKRIYQKSEIHDGNKCIEILEILEYVNGSQSSPETTTSDENQNNCMKNKKSRIPIPIFEKLQRTNESNRSNSRRSSVRVERNGNTNVGNTNRLIADMLLGALGEPTAPPPAPLPPTAPRRASVPHEPRSRSNSLRFKQTFDIIPEERSSLSLDSGTEDLNHNRRASAPDVADQYRESPDADCNDAPPTSPAFCSLACDNPQNKLKPQPDSPRRCKDMKSAGTSPITESDGDKRALRSKNQTTMTSPSSKSAATSPMRHTATGDGVKGEVGLAGKRGSGARGRAWLGFTRPEARAPHDEGISLSVSCAPPLLSHRTASSVPVE